MEAILEAHGARHVRQERSAAHAPRRPGARRCSYGGDGNGARRRSRCEPKALLKILHSESGAEHADLAEARRRGRHARAGQGLPARSGHPPGAARRLLPRRDGPLLQVTIPIIVKGEPKGVKQQGGILEFIRREIEIECLPADIPEHIDVDVSELMLHQGIRVRDIATNPKWKPVSDADMMLVHVIMPKAEEVAAPADAAAAADRRRRPSPKSSRRARRKRTRKTTRRRTTRRRTSKKK